MNATTIQNLEARRNKLGISKTALAKRAHISLPTVERILLGKERNPRIQNVAAIAATLGVTIRIGMANDVQEDQPASDFQMARAKAKARKLVRLVQGNMSLEAQGVDSGTIEQMVDQTSLDLLVGSKRRLWSE